MDNANEWYFVVDDEDGRRREGPVSVKDLAALLSAGRIFPVTPVWHEGMADWAQIGSVPDFSQSTQSPGRPSVFDTPESSNAGGTSDMVTIRDLDNHTIQFSKSRNVLLIATNDYHAGPLVLTKLDLLGLLTEMEISIQQQQPIKLTGNDT